MNELSTIVPTVIDLEILAQALGVPVSRIVATTYLAELARLYGNEHLHAKLLSSSFMFHVCPACIAEERKLSRLLTLPHIMHCPEHHLSRQFLFMWSSSAIVSSTNTAIYLLQVRP